MPLADSGTLNAEVRALSAMWERLPDDVPLDAVSFLAGANYALKWALGQPIPSPSAAVIPAGPLTN